MSKSGLEGQIRACIDSFVEELTALVRQAAVESVREALGSAPSAKRRGRARAAAGRKRLRRSATSLDSLSSRLLSHVKANPGQGITEIAAALGATSKELRLPVQKLLGEKKLRTTGQRRGTKYRAAGRAGGRRAAPRKVRKRKAARRKATRAKGRRSAKKRKKGK